MNSFFVGRSGGVLKHDSDANTFSPADDISFSRNLGHLDKSLPYPNGGCILRPCLAEYSNGCRRSESHMSQKSLRSSVPSSRRRSRGPHISIMVPIQVDVVLRGSNVSSFAPTLNSLVGGSKCWQKLRLGAASPPVFFRYSFQSNSSSVFWF